MAQASNTHSHTQCTHVAMDGIVISCAHTDAAAQVGHDDVHAMLQHVFWAFDSDNNGYLVSRHLLAAAAALIWATFRVATGCLCLSLDTACDCHSPLPVLQTCAQNQRRPMLLAHSRNCDTS